MTHKGIYSDQNISEEELLTESINDDLIAIIDGDVTISLAHKIEADGFITVHPAIVS